MATVPELIEMALRFHQEGNLPRAETIYRQILLAQPNDVDANHLLGVLLMQAGHAEAALMPLRRAIVLGSGHAMLHASLGDALRAAGQIPQAIAAYRQAAQLEPQTSEYLGKLGILFQATGRWDEAAAAYRQAVQLNPRDSIACCNLAAISIERRDWQAAHEWIDQALASDPEFSEAYVNLGTLRREQGDYEASEAAFQRALKLKSDSVPAHKQLAILYGRQGDIRAAARCLEQVVQLASQDIEGRNLLGVAYNTLDRLPEAIGQFNEALRLQPNFSAAWANLGLAQGALGLTVEARQSFERSLQLHPRDGVRLRSALLLPAIPESNAEIAQVRQQLQANIAQLMSAPLEIAHPIDEVGRTVFFPAFHGLNDRDLQRQLAELFLHATPSLAFVAPHCLSRVSPPKTKPKRGRKVPTTGDKLRVAFLSRDWLQHSIGIQNLELVRGLPRERLQVIVVRWGDEQDQLTAVVEAAADEQVVLRGSLAEWREQLSAARLDILCYTELGRDPAAYFLAFSRLAPVQCVLPGHPVTTGLSTIDYFLSSAACEPKTGAKHYTERLVKLQQLALGRAPLQPVALTATRADYGLSDSSRLYVCPQMQLKIHPDFDDLAREILQRDPQGVLVMFHDAQRRHSPLLAERLKRTLAEVAERVMFLDRLSLDGFFHFLTLADALLDSVHFNGGTTSYQALSLGLPVVTLPGKFLRGRTTLGLYEHLGVLDCVAHDGDEYVDIAVRLANDRTWRDEISARLRAAAQAFPAAASAQELGEFFLSVAPAR